MERASIVRSNRSREDNPPNAEARTGVPGVVGVSALGGMWLDAFPPFFYVFVGILTLGTYSVPRKVCFVQPPIRSRAKKKRSMSRAPTPLVPSAPCGALDCFSRTVSSRATSATTTASATVILAVTNHGFAHFWHNLRCTLEHLEIAKHAIVVGTDAAACAAAASESVPCLLGDSLFWPPHGGANSRAGSAAQTTAQTSAQTTAQTTAHIDTEMNGADGSRPAAEALPNDAVDHGSAPYARLMHIKAKPTLAVLRLGYSVLSTDTDVVFFRDPLAGVSEPNQNGQATWP